MRRAGPGGPALDAVERRMNELGCGDAVAELHFLVGVEPRFLFPYALSSRRSYDPGPCEELLSRLVEALRRPGAPRARILALRGRLLRVLDRREEALAAFDAALALAPRDARALGWRAELLLRAKDGAARGIEGLTAAATADPASPWPAVWAAAWLLPKSASPEAFSALDAALAAAPRHVPALLLRAVAHERCGRLDAALDDAAAAARLAPSSAGAFVLRGRLQARLGRHEDAAASFAAATRFEPDAKAFYAEIVTADQPLGKGVFGLEQLGAYIRAHPSASWAYALRGDMLRAGSAGAKVSRAAGRPRGLSDLERAVKLDPETPWMRACLARTQVQMLKSGDGVLNLRAAIAQDPRCGWLRAWLAESHRQFKRPEDAARLFRRAVALSPRFAQAHVWLGRLHCDRGLWEPGVEEFTRAIRLDCDYGFAYAKRGHALFQLGRHAEALPDFERALVLKSNSHGLDWIRALRKQSLKAVGLRRA